MSFRILCERCRAISEPVNPLADPTVPPKDWLILPNPELENPKTVGPFHLCSNCREHLSDWIKKKGTQ